MRSCPHCGHGEEYHQRATTCVGRECECGAFADEVGWWRPLKSRYVLMLRDPQ